MPDDAATHLHQDILVQRPADAGPRSVPVTFRIAAADKEILLDLADKLGWTQTDVVVAALHELGAKRPYILTRIEAGRLEQFLEQVRGIASNVNTVVRDFHVVRNAFSDTGRAESAEVEAGLAAMAECLHRQVVQPIARILGLRISLPALHRPRLAGQIPSTAQRLLRDRRPRSDRIDPAQG